NKVLFLLVQRRRFLLEMNTVSLFEFILYFVAMIGIAYVMSRTKMSHSVFLLGGKKLPGGVLAFSERATGESAWLLLGFTVFVFTTGLSAVWVAAGIASGIVFSWLVLPRSVRIEVDECGVLTLPDYLAVKFHAEANMIRWIASILIASLFM